MIPYLQGAHPTPEQSRWRQDQNKMFSQNKMEQKGCRFLRKFKARSARTSVLLKPSIFSIEDPSKVEGRSPGIVAKRLFKAA